MVPNKAPLVEAMLNEANAGKAGIRFLDSAFQRAVATPKSNFEKISLLRPHHTLAKDVVVSPTAPNRGIHRSLPEQPAPAKMRTT